MSERYAENIGNVDMLLAGSQMGQGMYSNAVSFLHQERDRFNADLLTDNLVLEAAQITLLEFLKADSVVVDEDAGTKILSCNEREHHENHRIVARAGDREIVEISGTISWSDSKTGELITKPTSHVRYFGQLATTADQA